MKADVQKGGSLRTEGTEMFQTGRVGFMTRSSNRLNLFLMLSVKGFEGRDE